MVQNWVLKKRRLEIQKLHLQSETQESGMMNSNYTHTIHVWYIFLQLVDFFMVNVGKYTSPMDGMGFYPKNLDLLRPPGAPGFIAAKKMSFFSCCSAFACLGNLPYIWSNYSDLTRPISPKWWFSKGNPLISGKSRLVKYYNLARYIPVLGLLWQSSLHLLMFIYRISF